MVTHRPARPSWVRYCPYQFAKFEFAWELPIQTQCLDSSNWSNLPRSNETFTVHTVQSAQCKLHTTHCTLQTAHCTLHTAHSTLHNENCKVQTENCTLDFAKCTPHCTPLSLRSLLYSFLKHARFLVPAFLRPLLSLVRDSLEQTGAGKDLLTQWTSEAKWIILGVSYFSILKSNF